MHKKRTFFTMLTLSIVIVAGLLLLPKLRSDGNVNSGHALARPPAKAPVPVITAVATTEPFIETLEALGTVSAKESVEVTPTVDDRVVGIFFEDGDIVSQGQVLVKLDDSEAQYLLVEARAALQEQRKQFARVSRLAQTNATSRSQLDEEKSLLEIAKAKVDNLQARLQDYTIRAPFSGILGTRRVSTGAVVDSDSVITTLDDTTIVKVDFTIPELYLGVLRIGMDVSAHSPAYPDRKFVGTVTAISSRVDPETRTLTIRAQLPNPDRLLKPGMLLAVDLVKDRSRSLIIPEEAVIQEKDKKFILLVTPENTVEKKEIVTGRRSPGKVEVISGLKDGHQVVVQGITRVRPGAAVNVVEIRKTGPTSG
jgi:membrane fusion protein (multidrug efflux system)